MSATIPVATLEKFSTFGDLLRFLRRRVGITQTELSIAVGYSTSQISRLEQNLRLPDIPTIEARFSSALDLDQDPRALSRLLELAASVRREDAPAPGLCPYKGLNCFDESDADLFVGREALTMRLVDRTLALGSGTTAIAGRFLAIVGASGSGKSSLLRAGLVRALRWNRASTNWHIQILTPGARPLQSLAACLTRESGSMIATATLIDDLAGDSRSLHLHAERRLHSGNRSTSLLLVDQFEELFALCRSEEERLAFIANLLTAANEPDGPTVVLIALRADFYAHCAAYQELREAIASSQEYIGTMASPELRRAIEEPARRAHWELEPGLVDLLLHDIGHEPGALPLLSHALLETWERRQGTLLTLSGYAASGGVRGAIAETAEAVFTDQFDHQQQAIARRIFLRLTELGDETATGDTRRRATYDELILKPEEAGTTQAVLKALADARLIITSEDSAEVAHEALIREWPTLRGWLEENREGLRLHRSLTEAAQDWQGMERAPDMLFRGTRLAQAQDWAEAHVDDLNTLEREFLGASEGQRELEVQEREDQQKRELHAAQKLAETEKSAAARLRLRNRIITVVGAVAFVLAVLAGAFALNSNANATVANDQSLAAKNARATAVFEQQSADQAAAVSFSRELAAQSELNLNIDPERSILLALAGLDKAHTREAENALHDAVSSSHVRMVLSGHMGEVNQVAYSPDGKSIASIGQDGTARLWDATTGKQIFSLQHPGDVRVESISPDGSRLATIASDGILRIWNVATGSQLQAFAVTQGNMSAASAPLVLSFIAEGKLLATIGNAESTVSFWDPSSGSKMFTLSAPDWSSSEAGNDLIPSSFAFSPDGKLMAIALSTSGNTGLGRIELWNPQTRQRMSSLSGQFDAGGSLSFSPDGKRLVSSRGPGDGQPAVWEVDSGKLLFQLRDGVNDIRFSADGKYLISASGGGRGKVFDAQTGDPLLVLLGHTGIVMSIAGSPACAKPPAAAFAWCGGEVATAGTDGTIRVWDISPSGEQELLTVPGESYALSPDGKRLTSVSYDPFPPQPDASTTVTFATQDLPSTIPSNAPSGYTLSSAQLDEHFRDWFFLRSGFLAVLFDNSPIKLWDVAGGGKPVYPISCCMWKQGMMLDISSQPHPRMAVADPQAGRVVIWDLAADTNVQTIQVTASGAGDSEAVWSIVLSPDGQRLVTFRRWQPSIAEIWDVTTGRKLVTMPGPGTSSVGWLGFSRDGKWLVVTDCAGLVVLRDASTGAEVHRFSGPGSCIGGVTFSPDGKLIAVSSSNRQQVLYELQTGQEVLTLPGGWFNAFTPDGSRLVVLNENGAIVPNTIRVYLLRLDDLIALAKTRLTRALTAAECQQYLHLEACPPGE